MITSGLCDSFHLELLQAVHDFAHDTFKIALIAAGHVGTYGPATETYSDLTDNGDEATDTSGNARYVAGGATLAGVALALADGVAFVDWTVNPSWGPDASISAAGALVYNASKGNKAVCVLAFSEVKTSTMGPFTITLPPPTSALGILRISGG